MSRAPVPGIGHSLCGAGHEPAPPSLVESSVIFSRMTVRVLLFARYAELAGREAVEVSISAAATVGDVLQQLRGSIPGAESLPERPLVAVNQVHARLDTPVADGDELAVLPPMAGG